MKQFIIDISANTHKNNWDYLKRMLDELKAVDTGEYKVIIKHQLFVRAGDNIPLQKEIFYKAYNYARELRYKTTSSVFDKESLAFLLQYSIPFVKIANDRKLDWIIGEIPRKIPIYISSGTDSELTLLPNSGLALLPNTTLCCISNYPANMEQYEQQFKKFQLIKAISDHTTNWNLFNRYLPVVYECHYKLEDSTGLDAGDFARTPKMLAEVL